MNALLTLRPIVVGQLCLLVSTLACSAPQTLPPKGPQTAAAVLAKALAVPLVSTLQGMSRLDSYVDGQARKADVLLRVERPGKAQFQALTPTLDMLAVLTTDGSTFSSFERGASRCYAGEACPANIARIVPIALPPSEMVAAVLGRPPLIASDKRKLEWDGERGAYRVTLGPTLDGHRQQLWIRPGDFRFLASIVYRDGKRVASIAYSGHDKIKKGGPPQLMRMKVASHKTDMSLQLRDVEVDEVIEADAFSVECPAGTVRVHLPCAATSVLAPPPPRSAP